MPVDIAPPPPVVPTGRASFSYQRTVAFVLGFGLVAAALQIALTMFGPAI